MELALRQQMRRRRPKFRAQDSHKKARVKARWRKPRGITSKIRLAKRGYGEEVSIGYRSPRKTRGLSISGKRIVFVANPLMLNGLTSEHEVILPSSLGRRKRLAIVKEAVSRNLPISGMRDPAAFLARVEQELQQRKGEKQQRSREREKKQKERESKAEAKAAMPEQKADAAKSEEERKEAEKKELDKVLTQKD